MKFEDNEYEMANFTWDFDKYLQWIELNHSRLLLRRKQVPSLNRCILESFSCSSLFLMLTGRDFFSCEANYDSSDKYH